MKILVSFLLLVTLAVIVTKAYVSPVLEPKQPPFPGQGPFNPRIKHSPRKHGQISVDVKKEGGKTSWNAEVKQNIYENKHGSIYVSGGSNKQPNYKPQGHVGIGGSFQWG